MAGGGSAELSRALAKITSLSKQKAVLTELSNRLRSELLRAGINTRQLSSPVNPSGVDPPVISDAMGSEAAASKLDQLEQLQYKLAKEGMKQHIMQNPSKNNKENLFQPDTIPTKISNKKGAMPSAVDLSSNSDSTMKPKSKPSVLQPRAPKSRLYQAPTPAVKPRSSNVPWIKTKKNDTSSNRKSIASTLEPAEQKAHTKHVQTGTIMQSAPSAVLDSMDLGSSIQEVWNFLDEQPSVASSNLS